MAEGILLDNGAVGVIFKKLTGLPSAEWWLRPGVLESDWLGSNLDSATWA